MEATISLPFLQAKRVGAVIMAKHKIDTSPATEVQSEEGEPKPELMDVAQTLISAMHSKDATAVAHALEDAFSILDDDSGEAAPEMPEGQG